MLFHPLYCILGTYLLSLLQQQTHGGVLLSERRSHDMVIKQKSSQDEVLHTLYVLYTYFICGFIRRLILRAIVHKKENHGSIVVGESRKFTSSFLTTIQKVKYMNHNT